MEVEAPEEHGDAPAPITPKPGPKGAARGAAPSPAAPEKRMFQVWTGVNISVGRGLCPQQGRRTEPRRTREAHVPGMDREWSAVLHTQGCRSGYICEPPGLQLDQML